MSRPVDFRYEGHTHSYFLGGLRIPSVTQVMVGINDFLQMDPEIMAAAQERGTLVHTATALYDKDDLALEEMQSDPILEPYVRAWVKFRDDVLFIPEAIEVRVYSTRYRYAGTIDRIGALRGVRAILDIKTSATPNPVAALQLAAYQVAYNEQNPKAKAKERWVVQLGADGKYRLHQYKDDLGDWSTFLSALQLFNWRKKNT